MRAKYTAVEKIVGIVCAKAELSAADVEELLGDHHRVVDRDGRREVNPSSHEQGKGDRYAQSVQVSNEDTTEVCKVIVKFATSGCAT